MKIKYVPGETIQEASEIDSAEDFLTITKALQFYGGRVLVERGKVFVPTPQEISLREEIEETFVNLNLYMQAGLSKLADEYGPTWLNPRHTNFVLDSLTSLSTQSPEALIGDDVAFAPFILAAQYLLDHIEEDSNLRESLVEASLVAA